ncbi:hypothetical protein GDO78_018717 [Eleutherodactylus coqui]|uniref:Uncharacterized protein n=1 Tax=Eleutherodactylus coqui TaxID=57060 RepID=A0A8J6B3S2_ELECQ|nr:hypothetical protein GDO78_018717 [Eleutherodactylus coqui]
MVPGSAENPQRTVLSLLPPGVMNSVSTNLCPSGGSLQHSEKTILDSGQRIPPQQRTLVKRWLPPSKKICLF